MKIFTITCHHAYNYGASLQAHALMSALEGLGHDVEIIDYIPWYVKKYNSLWMIGERFKRNLFYVCAFYSYVVPIRLLQYKKRRLFDIFDKKYLKLTKRYNSYEDLKKDPPAGDVIFCGSDQIWNTTINNGLDPSYYAAFAPNKTVRASYAASFSISQLPESHKAFVNDMLSKMNRISVREKTGLSILEDLGISKGQVVADPVFLPDADHWHSLTCPIKYNNYLLVYDQENSTEIRSVAKKIASKNNLKIISFRDLYPRFYANNSIWNAGPIEFLSLIKNASFVVTNSFHCTAFSLIFEKEFVVIPRTHQKVNSRMKDLTSSFGVADRYVNSICNLESIKPINFEAVRKKIQQLRSDSFGFIEDTLKLKEIHN